MLKKIAGSFAVVVVFVCISAALQPTDFVIARSETIRVTPAAVFPMINNLKNWQAWSPYMQMDPEMKSTFAGPEEGVGASHSWDGPKAGKGTMTITKIEPNVTVDLRLDFEKPMAATNTAQFILAPESAGAVTVVFWSMSGKNNFVGKLFGLFVNVDKMVGADFEKGLANLKAKLEAPTAATSATEVAPDSSTNDAKSK